VRLLKSRQSIATSFVQCLTATGTSQSVAARVMGLTKRTVGSWARAERPIMVERVLAAPRLASAFRDQLCSYDHGSDSAGYVLKKPRGSK